MTRGPGNERFLNVPLRGWRWMLVLVGACAILTSPFIGALVGTSSQSLAGWVTAGVLVVGTSLVIGAAVAGSLAGGIRTTSAADPATDDDETAEIDRRISQDALTGLVNQSAFQARLQDELRVNPARTAVLFLDLDDFKQVNDTMGHAVGDDLLVAVAQRLRQGLRDGDTVARLGGDEFAVLMRDIDAIAAPVAAQRFLTELKAPFSLRGRAVLVRSSGGLAVSADLGDGPVEQQAKDLLRHADLAMYASKRAQNQTITLFHAQMHRDLIERLELESDLHRALTEEQFFLEYQPIVDARYGTVRATEALLRWSHPTRGQIGPDVFIPIAEETGLIVPLTLWVVRQAAHQLLRWDHVTETRDLGVALNVSGRLVVEPGIGAAIARELNAVGVDPRRLILEVTESLLMEERGNRLQTLCQLRAFGMRLSVDDFGTGYSSLSRLADLPIDEVKIDRQFIRRLDQEAGRAVVAASIAMAHGLGLRVVAEGVESEDQLNTLRALRCDDVQGFLFSRPILPVGLADLLATEGAEFAQRPIIVGTMTDSAGGTMTGSARERGQQA